MTEEEAHTKWCPMARPVLNEQTTMASVRDDTRCIASGCMMWRWTPIGRRQQTNLGYCGLAGVEFGPR